MTASTEAAATATVPAKPLDEFGAQAKTRLVSLIEQFNVVAAQVKAAQGDPQGLLESLRDNYTEDPEVAKITEQIERLDAKREELFAQRDTLLKPVVEQKIAAAKEGSEDAETAMNDLAKSIRSAKNYINDLYGEGHLEDLPKMVGKRQGGGNAGGGTGQRRIRGFDVYIDGTLATSRNGKGEQVSNLATAAKELKVDTEVLREQFFAAAGTDDSSKFPKTVEFSIRVGEGDEAKSVTIKAVKVEKDEERATEVGKADAPAA